MRKDVTPSRRCVSWYRMTMHVPCSHTGRFPMNDIPGQDVCLRPA